MLSDKTYEMVKKISNFRVIGKRKTTVNIAGKEMEVIEQLVSVTDPVTQTSTLVVIPTFI